MFENPRRGRQARNFTTNVPKILDLKSSSEQIFSKNCRWVPLLLALTVRCNEAKENRQNVILWAVWSRPTLLCILCQMLFTKLNIYLKSLFCSED